MNADEFRGYVLSFIFYSYLANFQKEALKYSLSDLVEALSKNNIRVSTSKVSEVLKN